jgi:hypothetical protein
MRSKRFRSRAAISPITALGVIRDCAISFDVESARGTFLRCNSLNFLVAPRWLETCSRFHADTGQPAVGESRKGPRSLTIAGLFTDKPPGWQYKLQARGGVE